MVPDKRTAVPDITAEGGTEIGIAGLHKTRRERRMPKEVKPSMLDMATNITVIGVVAAICGTAVFTFVSDFSKYFHQFPYAGWMAPHVMMLWGVLSMDEEFKDVLNYLWPLVMDMGVSPASGHAQRTGDFLVDVWMELMRIVEEHWWRRCKNKAALRWREHRRSLAEETGKVEDRLCFAAIYTDDPCFCTMGNYLTIEGLRMWKAVTSAANFWLASMDKNMLGLWVKWTGLLHYTAFGMTVVDVAKQVKLKAEGELVKVGHMMDWQQYRSIISRQRYYMQVCTKTCRDVRSRMQPLYSPYKIKGSASPMITGSVRITKHIKEAIVHNSNDISACPAAAYDVLLLESAAVTYGPSGYHLMGDACGTDVLKVGQVPVMAGWMHGVWWRYELSRDMWELLHITATELATVGINLIQFDPLMHEQAEVVMWTDALVPRMVLPEAFSCEE